MWRKKIACCHTCERMRTRASHVEFFSTVMLFDPYSATAKIACRPPERYDSEANFHLFSSVRAAISHFNVSPFLVTGRPHTTQVFYIAERCNGIFCLGISFLRLLSMMARKVFGGRYSCRHISVCPRHRRIKTMIRTFENESSWSLNAVSFE